MNLPKSYTFPFPRSWGLELVRNESGRAFYYLSRFVSNTEVEYINDVEGKPKCFRRKCDASAALSEARAAASKTSGSAQLRKTIKPALAGVSDCVGLDSPSHHNMHGK